MSRSYFHRRHRKPEKTPPYWIRLKHMKPERRYVNKACQQIVKGADCDEFDLKALRYRVLDYWM
jgi:hypothetical protein